jgi:ornithine carbamoyltransferase
LTARASPMTKRDFLTFEDLTKPQVDTLLGLAQKMKNGSYTGKPFDNKTLAMIFAKSSTRTRVSFEVGTYQLGGHALFLSARDIQLGRGEPIKDMARVLSRMVDMIMIRTFAHADVVELAKWATVPVINALTDLHHPCQILADLQTMVQHVGGYEGKKVAWIGDGNNMANSWLDAAALLGFELRLACPEGYEPDHDVFERASKATKILITEEPDEAVEGADVVNTDVWASMGQEEEAEKRKQAFKGYCVDENLMKRANPGAIFLHCLPAHRGEEVTEAVLEGRQSRIFDEAENRLHAQKALMVHLLG